MTADFFQFRQRLYKPRGAAKPAGQGDGGAAAAQTVSQLTEQIRQVIGAGMPGTVLVRGEVSNLNWNKASGHIYFTLKDADACLDCVMYRSDAARLKFEPEAGMELLANGRIGVYPTRGRYQLYVNQLRPLGQGALELAFRQMKAKLEAEGLFDAGRKKAVPDYPLRIVLMTSREAAALHDMLKVLRRYAWLRIKLYPVPVQGEGSGQKIAAAIGHLNQSIDSVGGADVILLGRGGGSLEDLWAFNEEAVARAIVESRIPIVTGIGHEVDVRIADLVSDHHAHTPTEAAQVITAKWRLASDLLDGSSHSLRRALRVVVSDVRQRLEMVERHEAFRRPTDRINGLRQLVDDRQHFLVAGQERILRELRDRVQGCSHSLERYLPGTLLRSANLVAAHRRRLEQAFVQRLRSSNQRVGVLQTSLQEMHPRLAVRLAGQRLEVAGNGLVRAWEGRHQATSVRLDATARQLEAVSPPAVLRRGYTITSRKKDGVPLRSAADLKAGEKIVTRFADGQTESIIEDTKQLSLFE